jgi:hypothetical protein
MRIALGQLVQYDIWAFVYAYYVGKGAAVGLSIPNIQDQEDAVHPVREFLKLIRWHLDRF